MVLDDERSAKRAASAEAKALFYALIFFGSFLAHDFLQETIIRSEGWDFPLFMTLLEFGSCCAFSFILEKPLASTEPPIKSYGALTSTGVLQWHRCAQSHNNTDLYPSIRSCQHDHQFSVPRCWLTYHLAT